MNNINFILNSTVSKTIEFGGKNGQDKWFLLLLIPAVILALWPYFRLRKDKRRTRNRIVSMILHIMILTLITLVFSGFKIVSNQTITKAETIILVDVSDSNVQNANEIQQFVADTLKEKTSDMKVGIYAFGCGNPREVAPLSINTSASSVANIFGDDSSDSIAQTDSDAEGYVRIAGTDISKAVEYVAKKYNNVNDLSSSKLVIISDGVETDGNLKSTISKYTAAGLTVDAVYFQAPDYDGKYEMLANNLKPSDSTPEKNVPIDIVVTVKTHHAGNASVQLYDYADVDGKEIAVGEPIDVVFSEYDVGKEIEVKIPAVKFVEDGVHPIKAVLTPDEAFKNDGNDNGHVDWEANNTYYNYVLVKGQTDTILIIDGTGTGAVGLLNLIDSEKDASNKYKVEVKTPAQAPTNLSEYGEVILLNVDSKVLPQNYDGVIERFVKNGGGLLTVGGDKTFYNGGMGSNKFAKVLPISVKPEATDTKAVMLCIDYSSGMAGGKGSTDLNYQGASYTPAELIAKGLKKALTSGAFSEDDYVGILLFGGKEPTDQYMPIILPITPASEVLYIYNAIAKIDPNVTDAIGNTEWRRPLEKAAEMLRAYPQGDTKHIIMITEGASSDNFVDGETSKNFTYNGMVYRDGGWKHYGETLNSSVPADKQNVCYTGYIYDKYGITTSSMWVFYDASATVKGYLNQMATDGHGRFYDLTTPEQIAEAVDKECKAIPKKVVNTGEDYTLKVISSVSATTGVNSADLPVLKGYNGCSLKDGATSYIETETNTVYASWEYGAGSSGALMTDITSATWAKDFADDAEGQKLLKWMVNENFATKTSNLSTDAEYSFERENFTTTIRVSEIENAQINYIEAAAFDQNKGIDPDAVNKSDKEPMDKVIELVPIDSSVVLNEASGSFIGKLQMMTPGLYTITFYRGETNEDGTQVYALDTVVPYTYEAFSYSNEYNTFIDTEASYKLLKNVSNGDFIYANQTEENPDDPNEEGTGILEGQDLVSEFNPATLFMIIAVILFILDVCARKFHFLWPHEIIKKLRGEKVEIQA